jgi:hypothetical protein
MTGAGDNISEDIKGNGRACVWAVQEIPLAMRVENFLVKKNQRISSLVERHQFPKCSPPIEIAYTEWNFSVLNEKCISE